jgi:hypothetical protein
MCGTFRQVFRAISDEEVNAVRAALETVTTLSCEPRVLIDLRIILVRTDHTQRLSSSHYPCPATVAWRGQLDETC